MTIQKNHYTKIADSIHEVLFSTPSAEIALVLKELSEKLADQFVQENKGPAKTEFDRQKFLVRCGVI